MKRPWNLAALVGALVLLGPAPATASTLTECHTKIRELSQRTGDLLFLRGDQGTKAQARLLAHLDGAQDRLDKIDFKEALKQMDAYSTDLSRAIASRTLQPDHALFLQERANAVITCITGIGK